MKIPFISSNRSLVLLFITALISACGGGDDDNGGNEPLTGVFIDGPVQGLSYETATQSGLTNASGQFIYRAGETVTFSIGGVELGSAPGAAQLSPFDLFDMEPITDELALRLELSTYKDVTDFDRVANIAFLLVSLDNDANPDNGIDLTGWDSALAGTPLDFNVNLYQFARKFRRFARAHGINPDVTPMEPLSHLYKSLGIHVQVHLVTSIITDSNNDGRNDSLIQHTYDDRGLLLSDPPSTFTYTPDGRIASRIDQDFFITDSETNTYNSNGDLATTIFEYEYDNSSVGGGSWPFEERTTGIAAYNEFGDLVSWSLETDRDLDGIDSTTIFKYTYDSNGNRLTATMEADFNHDGVVDDKDVSTYTYDSAGRQLTRQTNDFLVVNTYDAAGNLLTRTFMEGSDSETTTNTYDSGGNLLTSLREERSGSGSLEDRYRTTYTYNSDKTLRLRVFYEFDSNGDSVFEGTATAAFTYDTHGNLLTELHQSDADADGVIDLTHVVEHQYTPHSDGMFSLLFHYSDLKFFRPARPPFNPFL